MISVTYNGFLSKQILEEKGETGLKRSMICPNYVLLKSKGSLPIPAACSPGLEESHAIHLNAVAEF